MQPSASLRTAEESSSPSIARFVESVRAGLLTGGQKRLSPEYFYDEIGSALFEAITLLPEYGLTRADRRILATHADRITRSLPAPVSVIELGSGSGTKTAYLLRSLARRQGGVEYCPIDLSRTALQHCERELSATARVHPIQARFVEGVGRALAAIENSASVLVLFLGSTIGNFDHEAAVALLSDIRRALGSDGWLLIGADLVKPVEQILLAYDDPAGITAAFNKNLLARMNRELGADFDLRRFRHEARYDQAHHRVEMHLTAECAHVVTIPAAECEVRFGAGESIWTESSYKYDAASLQRMAAGSGFRVLDAWTDDEWPFAESLWRCA